MESDWYSLILLVEMNFKIEISFTVVFFYTGKWWFMLCAASVFCTGCLQSVSIDGMYIFAMARSCSSVACTPKGTVSLLYIIQDAIREKWIGCLLITYILPQLVNPISSTFYGHVISQFFILSSSRLENLQNSWFEISVLGWHIYGCSFWGSS